MDAQEMAAIAAAAGTPDEESDAWVVSDLAATVHVSEHSVGTRLALTRRVGSNLPQSWVALHAAQITLGHLRAIDAVTEQLTPEQAQAVEARVLPRAIEREWTPAALRDAARKAVLKVDPDGARQRAAKAKVQHSDVRLYSREDEMSDLVVTGDAWTNRQVMDELNRRADALKLAGDPRKLGELKLAALAHALLEVPSVQSLQPQPADPPRPARTPKRAQALVILDLPTLLGLRDNPGELAGHGPITAELARRVAADATLRLLVLSPVDGKPVGLGRSSYSPSPEMRRWIDVRDRTCLFPGCRRRAVYCDADHAEEWDQGGETDCDNCGLLCRKHHNYKTRKAWDVTRTPDDDSVRWTSPYGHEFAVEPDSYDEELDPRDSQDDREGRQLPPELGVAVPQEEWERRWQSWPRAG
jgi:hypothetical protein